MSKEEIQEFEILEKYRRGELTRREAAEKLLVTPKTIQRRAKRVREKGILGLKHGNCGRVPVNKIADGIRDLFLSKYRGEYFDFNFKHALEMMKERDGMVVGYDTFVGWCRSAGLGKVRRRRSSRARIARERSANEGYMLQMDGSPHAWNGEETWTMVSLIDDATSDIPHAEFHPSETTWACMNVLRKAIEKRGIPEFILTDEAGWSAGSHKRRHFSQFVRACKELGITVITTPSPESKGRVERQFRTNQDRLIPELRLHGIKSMLDANRYLEQVYLPEWREKRTVAPLSNDKRYRQLPAHVSLHEVFCLKYERIVAKNQVVNIDGRRLRLDANKLGSLWRKQVEVREYEDETLKIFFGDVDLPYTELSVEKVRRWAS